MVAPLRKRWKNGLVVIAAPVLLRDPGRDRAAARYAAGSAGWVSIGRHGARELHNVEKSEGGVGGVVAAAGAWTIRSGLWSR